MDFETGILVVPRLKETEPEKVRKFPKVFHVSQGKVCSSSPQVTLKVDGKEVNLLTDSQCFLPPGKEYVFANQATTEARLAWFVPQ